MRKVEAKFHKYLWATRDWSLQLQNALATAVDSKWHHAQQEDKFNVSGRREAGQDQEEKTRMTDTGAVAVSDCCSYTRVSTGTKGDSK